MQYVEGLRPSNADYNGHDHSVISSYVRDIDPAQVTGVSNAYHDLHQAFREFADQLKDAVDKSQHEWEGEAAESARGYFSSLSQWAEANSQNAQLASETIYQQAEAASSAKNSMPEPIPFSWDSEMKKWGSDPFNFAGNIAQTIETYHASQEAHAQAAQVMAQYDGHLYEAASKQPAFAEPPKFGSGSGESGSVGSVPGNGGTDASGFVGGGVPGGGAPAGGSVAGGSVSGGVSGGGGSSLGGAGVAPPLAAGRGTGAVLPGGSGTRPAGFRNPSFSVPRSRPNSGNSGLGEMGPMPIGGMPPGGPGGGGGDYGGRVGRGVAGFGPGGGGAAGGAGAPGAGTGSGAAAKPGALGPTAPGGAGAAAAAGRGGMGAAGMGGAGRGGQGEEDKEHQRPTFLVEGDPDEVFGTDERTAPPVIGE
ncbi:WXG100 family type VII secretion target [Prauserella shujinwangii]|uniref:WXG100 family type VII secretion target n=1 Tax=Prauserella shujinwangii TaxID=1453103 RepID=UPI001FE73F11|nr:PPE domain-containing protein [Prauserella shujinwangii]